MRWLVLAATGCVLVIAASTTLLFRLLPAQTHTIESPITVIVEPGNSLTTVAEKLEASGVIDRPGVFTGWSQVSSRSSSIQAGEYAFSGEVSERSILDQLTKGNTVVHEIKLSEGMRLEVYLEQLRGEERLTNDLDEVSVDNIVEKLSLNTRERYGEGLFFPETYHFRRGDLASSILFRAFNLMSDELNEAWDKRSADVDLQSKYQLLTVASLIEKESSRVEDRHRIGGVIYRRLDRNMYLQIDPTVIYALGDQYKGSLLKSQLSFEHPYNTYRNKGLPPSPICSVSRAALLAAANPAEGDALYFVSRGDGTSQFSSTLKEHNRAVAKYVRKR